MFHTIEEAMIDLKNGKPIIVVDDESRENEGDFVALSEKVTPDLINFMITHGKGLVCTAITPSLAKKLDLNLMTNENTDPFETAFTVSIDHENTKTGISAYERAFTIKKMLDKKSRPSHFKRPGHIFPLIAKEEGVLIRPGHTEAAVDLAKLSGAFPSGVICEIVKKNGKMARVPDLKKLASQFNLKMITIKDLIYYRKVNEQHVKREIKTSLPTPFGKFHVYGYSNSFDDKEHIALVKGDLTKDEPILTRVHSKCLTGDVFFSHRCDCGLQLQKALKMIGEKKHGILIYMHQEGRGIGLLNKLRAYQLQEEGFDTVEANQRLGFAPDLRDYYISAQILHDLGVSTVNLLTNNPNKIKGLENYQINVNKRIALETERNKENEQYLKTKVEKLGHLLIN